MSGSNRNSECTYVFGPFRLLASTRVLLDGDRVVRLGSRAIEILIALVERAGELVNKRELMEIVWPDTVVVEANLAVHVAALRRALGEGESENKYIVNSPGRGYRFVAPIQIIERPTDGLEQTTTIALHNLPAQLAHLVGRRSLLKALQDQTQVSRLLSIVGPPGIGKTALAVCLAESVLSRYPDGVCFVDLAPVSSDQHVVSAFASSLPLDIRPIDQISGIVAALRSKRVLLVVDNCEHVIESAAAAVSMILHGSHSITVIATSREPLRIEGEHVHRLEPLGFPPSGWEGDPEAALNYASIQLFVERATGVVSGFSLAPEDVVSVSKICRKLDGNPLAIEIAAARVDSFGVHGLETRIDDLQFLAESHRGTSPRQRSIGAAVDWSYQLLSEGDRLVLRCLSIFAGGFTLDAAIAVVPLSNSEKDTATVVADLVRKSLVAVDTFDNEMRFRLLEITRAFARVRLTEHAEFDEVASGHCAYYEKLLAPLNKEPIKPSAVRAATIEIDNVRAGLTWAFDPAGKPSLGIRLAANAVPMWLERSLLVECIAWTRIAINAPSDEDECSHSEMVLRAGLGLASMFADGMSETAWDALNRATTIANKIGDREWELRAALGLVVFAQRAGDHRLALTLVKNAEELARSAKDIAALGMAESVKSCTLFLRGELNAASDAVRNARRYLRTRNDSSQIARWDIDYSLSALCVRGRVYWHQGLFEQARKVCLEVQALVDKSDRPTVICHALTWSNSSLFTILEEYDLAASAIAMLMNVAAANQLQSYFCIGLADRGGLAAFRGQYEEAERDLRCALEGLAQASHGNVYVTILSFLAEVLNVESRFEEALAASTEALDRARKSESFFWLPEILRTHGEVLLRSQKADLNQVESIFREALAIAAEQGALALELRASTSLARLLSEDRRGKEAYDLLNSVYARFVEGHDTAVLRRAKSQLEKLSLGIEGVSLR